MSTTNSPLDTERAFSPVRSRSDQSKIRGRISGPIPITSPPNDDFPIRNHPHEDGATPPPVSQSLTSDHTGAADIVHRHQTPPQSIHVRSRSSPIGPTGPRTASAQKRETSSALRQSSFSMGTSTGKASPQRKKSILRGAIGRLFGRKKKVIGGDAVQTDDSSRPTPESWARHRSTVLATPIAEDPDVEQRRSTPFVHDDYGRALRSHHVEDKDMSAIERSRTLVHTESNFSRRRPGGSGVVSIRERRAVNGELGGLSPRPVSVHARLSSQEFTSSNPEDIGRAITSEGYTGLKRRSRSLSAIASLVSGQPDRRRSRSGEIRYWRQSYDPDYKSPVASSHHHEIENFILEPEDTAQFQDAPEMQPSPVQPFSFGDMATMNQMAGMKITQAASIESRLSNLEERMVRLEKMLSGSHSTVSGYRPPSGGQDPRIRKHTTNTPSPASVKSHAAIHVETSKSQSSSLLNYPHFPAGRSLETQSPLSSNERPVSISTVRAATSLPSLTQELSRPLNGEHYTALMALLETERSARQALEAQVKTLGHQISVMSKTPDRFSKRFSREKSTFDYDYDDEVEDETMMSQAKSATDRFLVSQDSSMNTREHEDEDDATSYATSADGEANPDSPTLAKTTRTMSLSQLTYNRPVARSSDNPMPNVI